MLHCRYQGLQLLRLGTDALRTQVGMPRYGTIQQRLLLTMGRICHGQTLEAALRLPCRDIENKVSVLDAFSRFCIVVYATILTRAVAHTTHLLTKRKRDRERGRQDVLINNSVL